MAVIPAVSFDLSAVARSALNFPLATAASICLLSNATRAAISASFLSPAIAPSDWPALRLASRVAASIPRASVITLTRSAFAAS